jgi:hypothetical protein
MDPGRAGVWREEYLDSPRQNQSVAPGQSGAVKLKRSRLVTILLKDPSSAQPNHERQTHWDHSEGVRVVAVARKNSRRWKTPS